MVIIQLTNLSNQILSKLLNYASAANVNVAQLVEEIIEDAMLGNDIPGSLQATLERADQEASYDKEKLNIESMRISETIRVPLQSHHGGYLRTGLYPSQTAKERFEPQLHVEEKHPVSYCEAAVGSGEITNTKNITALKAEMTEIKIGKKFPGVLLARSERLPGGVGMADALASAFKNAKSPVEVAEQILAPEVSKEAQSFLEPPTPSEQNMEDWLQEAYKKINDLPTGSVFMANQFAPSGIDANTSRIFGRKLLHLLTIAKLYSSKKMGKSCTEYIRS